MALDYKNPADREQLYLNALLAYGELNQMIVAVEEMAECIQAVCKILRGGEDYRHLAEEVADTDIMLEQIRMIHSLHDDVDAWKAEKLRRLEDRIRRTAYAEND